MINSDDAEPFLEAIDENVYPVLSPSPSHLLPHLPHPPHPLFPITHPPPPHSHPPYHPPHLNLTLPPLLTDPSYPHLYIPLDPYHHLNIILNLLTFKYLFLSSLYLPPHSNVPHSPLYLSFTLSMSDITNPPLISFVRSLLPPHPYRAKL